MPENSFPSSHRLLKPDDFNVVFDQRDYSVSNKSILVLASKNALGFNRLGMIVGKKSLPHAVDRNRMKRHIRECFRHMNQIGLDVIALVRPSIRDTSYKKPREMISLLLHSLEEKSSRD